MFAASLAEWGALITALHGISARVTLPVHVQEAVWVYWLQCHHSHQAREVCSTGTGFADWRLQYQEARPWQKLLLTSMFAYISHACTYSTCT